MTMTERVKLLFKILASFWAVFNIFVSLVMPNVGAYFGRVTASFVTPYANTIGLNASWNFFSPDPAHTMYIRYTVYFYDDFGNEIRPTIEGFFPKEKNKSITSDLNKRDLYAMRFMVIEPKRLRVLFGPWLCRKYEGASSINMEHVVETVPPLDEVVTFKGETVRDLSQELQYSKVSHNCHSADEEVL